MNLLDMFDQGTLARLMGTYERGRDILGQSSSPLVQAMLGAADMAQGVPGAVRAGVKGMEGAVHGDYSDPTARTRDIIDGLGLVYGGSAFASAPKGALRAGIARDAGLPMDEASRMARARQLGFDTEAPLYHGTASDVEAFSRGRFGGATKAKSAQQGAWLTDDASTASGYAEHAQGEGVQKLIDRSYAAEARGDFNAAEALMAQAEQLEAAGGRGGNVLPVVARGKIKDLDMEGAQYDPDDINLTDLVQQARREGYDGVRFMNFSDEAGYGRYNPAGHVVMFDPKNIRSRFAAFDPAKSNSADLLAARPFAPPPQERDENTQAMRNYIIQMLVEKKQIPPGFY